MAEYPEILSPNWQERTHGIDRITIHHAAAPKVTAAAIAGCFLERNYVSANYCIGYGGEIAVSVPERYRAFTSSSRANDMRAVTIEVANSAGAPEDPDWPVSKASYDALIALCADICRRNGKTRMVWLGDRDARVAYEPGEGEMGMTVHRDFASTLCPGPYLMARMGEIAAAVTALLQAEQQAKEDNDMTLDKFKELMAEYRAELQDNDYSAAWAEEAIRWGIENGLLQGGGDVNGDPNYMFQDFLTREQFITVLYRFAQKMGKA